MDERHIGRHEQGWLRAEHNHHANAWGGRRFLSIPNPLVRPNSTNRATLIDTPMFDSATMFRLSITFAANDPAALTPSPIEFTPLAAARVKVTVRHGMDPRQGTVDDVFSLSPEAELQPGETGVTNPVWMPISYITSRKLTVLCEITPETGTQHDVWCDFACTPITAVDTEQILANRGGTNIFGWPSMFSIRTAQTNVTATELLPANAARRQFFITNEGTARLALSFGDALDLTAGAQRFDVMLDAKGGPNPFYRSGKDEHWGRVLGLWEGAGAGYAMAAETDIF